MSPQRTKFWLLATVIVAVLLLAGAGWVIRTLSQQNLEMLKGMHDMANVIDQQRHTATQPMADLDSAIAAVSGVWRVADAARHGMEQNTFVEFTETALIEHTIADGKERVRPGTCQWEWRPGGKLYGRVQYGDNDGDEFAITVINANTLRLDLGVTANPPTGHTASLTFERVNVFGAAGGGPTRQPGVYDELRPSMLVRLAGPAALMEALATDEVGLTKDFPRNADGTLTADGQARLEQLARDLTANLKVRMDTSTDLVDVGTITFTHPDPRVAQQLPTTLFNRYKDATLLEIHERLDISLTGIKKELAVESARLKDASMKKGRFEIEHRDYMLDKPNGLQGRLEQLSDALKKADRALWDEEQNLVWFREANNKQDTATATSKPAEEEAGEGENTKPTTIAVLDVQIATIHRKIESLKRDRDDLIGQIKATNKLVDASLVVRQNYQELIREEARIKESVEKLERQAAVAEADFRAEIAKRRTMLRVVQPSFLQPNRPLPPAGKSTITLTRSSAEEMAALMAGGAEPHEADAEKDAP